MFWYLIAILSLLGMIILHICKRILDRNMSPITILLIYMLIICIVLAKCIGPQSGITIK